jgi:hypothetical protein
VNDVHNEQAPYLFVSDGNRNCGRSGCTGLGEEGGAANHKQLRILCAQQQRPTHGVGGVGVGPESHGDGGRLAGILLQRLC